MFGFKLSNIKAKIDDVSVHDQIFLTFQAQTSGGFDPSGGAAAGDKFIIMHHLGLDETSLKIIVNRSRRLWRFSARGNHPGFYLIITHRKKRDTPQKRKGGADNPAESRLGNTHRGQKFLLFPGRQSGQLRLDLAADAQYRLCKLRTGGELIGK